MSVSTEERQRAIVALYIAAIEPYAPNRLAEFEKFLNSWDIVPVVDNEEIIGAVMRKDDELHLGLRRPPSSSARAVIRKTLVDTINKHGHAVTKLLRNHPAEENFCRRLGFVVTHEANNLVHMRCERTPYA